MQFQYRSMSLDKYLNAVLVHSPCGAPFDNVDHIKIYVGFKYERMYFFKEKKQTHTLVMIKLEVYLKFGKISCHKFEKVQL